MSFFGLGKDAPRALVSMRVLEKQGEIFMGRRMIVFEKEEIFASKLVDAQTSRLLRMHGICSPHSIPDIDRGEQLFDGTDLIFFLGHAVR